MLEESIDHAEEDVAARLLAEARTDAETLIRQIERTMRDAPEFVDAGERAAVESALAALRAAIRETDYDRIRELADRVNEASTPFAQRIMASSLKRALEQKRASEVAP